MNESAYVPDRHCQPFYARLLLACAIAAAGLFEARAAVPAYTSFRGAGGIIIVSNPPNGTIVIDGSGVIATGTNSSIGTYTNGVAVSMAATNNNFTAGTNMVLRGTNIGSTAHINYSLAPNVSIPGTLDVGGQSTFSDLALFNNIAVFNGTVTINAGATNGFVLTTDASGNATWRPPTGAGTNIGVGHTIYLDAAFGNDSTASRTNLLRPYLTASNAFAAILSGDTLVVRAGQYGVNPKADPANEPSNENQQAGISITNKNNIRIVGEPGSVLYMTSWRSNGIAFSCPMLRFQNCSNVVFDGITCIGLRTNMGALYMSFAGATLGSCSEVTFKNCTFSNWQNHAIFDSSFENANSHTRYVNNIFAEVGGTNHVTLATDGSAIAVLGANFESIGNHFYRNLRNMEFCCNGDVRKVLIRGNFSEGCWFDDIMLNSTNSSEVIIEGNISQSYTSRLVPGQATNAARWLNVYAGSNVMVRGNIVSGYAAGIIASPVAGLRIVDWQISKNEFRDTIVIPVSLPAPYTPLVGNTAVMARISVTENQFFNCPSVALVFNANNSVVARNEFYDCNVDAYPQGVLCIGWPTAGIMTNAENISIVQNKLVSSAANAGPGIVIYSMSSSNFVWGNEIDRKYATNIHDLGTGTRTRPVNLISPGKILATDTNRDEAGITVGPNLVNTGGVLSVNTNPVFNTVTGNNFGNTLLVLMSNICATVTTVSKGTNVIIVTNSVPGHTDYQVSATASGGSGTPGGANRSIQYNGTNQFVGNSFMQYDPLAFFSEFVGPTISINNGTQTNFMDPSGFGALSGDPMVLYTQFGTPQIRITTNGHVEPHTLSNSQNSASFLKPWKTNYANQFSAKAGLDIGGSGIATVTFADPSGPGTNYQLTTPTMASNIFERGPKNMTPGVRVYIPEGLTNQATNLTLTAGQIVTHNGTNYLPGPLSYPVSGSSSNQNIQIDFALGWSSYVIQDTSFSTNISIWLTNTWAAFPGRSISVEFGTNRTTYALQVTNLAADKVRYSPNLLTNGYPTFFKTNTSHFSLVFTMPATNYVIADAAFYR